MVLMAVTFWNLVPFPSLVNYFKNIEMILMKMLAGRPFHLIKQLEMLSSTKMANN